jgi:parallel beta-helix repeat protein
MGLSIRRAATLAALAAIAALPPAAAQAATIKVPATGSTASIQAAVDAASPGDTIRVAPGTYTGPDVNVNKDGITISGPRAAVIDASGQRFGITVGQKNAMGNLPRPADCAQPDQVYAVNDFTLDGLTIKNATFTGIFMMSVDDFRVTGGRYVDNAEYAIFPRCSRDGLIDKNHASGGEDALIYVGVDDNIRVEDNHVEGGVIGIELENTLNSYVSGNKATGNVAGIFVIVLPGLPTTTTEHVVIEKNVVNKNNLPNPFEPICTAPETPPGCVTELFDDLQLLPSGTGILNVGGFDVTIRDNVVNQNDTVGIGAVFNPLMGLSSLDTDASGNTVLQNGQAPDPRSTGSGDLVYLDDPTNGSCFTDNNHKTEDFPFGPPLCL